jgi:hypothetical protein
MGQEALVSPNVDGARALLQLMDAAGAPPLACLWVFNPDHDSWRLWIVPSKIPGRKANVPGPATREFYGFVASLIVENRDKVAGLDPGDVHMVESTHPAVVALSRFVRVDGTSTVRMSNNMLDGYFLPDAVILRLTPPKAA